MIAQNFYTARLSSQRIQHLRMFSSDLGSMNENEIIELVEAKVFEVLKSAAKCDH